MFCKKCGKKLNEGRMDFLIGKRWEELSDGYYCLECATLEIRRRRGEK